MKLIEHDGLRELFPDENMFLADKEKTVVYAGSIYLGIYDSPDNYIDVTAEEKQKIEEAAMQKYNEETNILDKNN